ncbi:hypothetical protein A3K02_00250 [candidate division WS6 bacterium RIFOXYD1_FULL_33_8]|nr:MAG: hypothetical protein A3K02_00250 [candidate division WS6 bacterium RIFOXYD1_FULL_33_8]
MVVIYVEQQACSFLVEQLQLYVYPLEQYPPDILSGSHHAKVGPFIVRIKIQDIIMIRSIFFT